MTPIELSFVVSPQTQAETARVLESFLEALTVANEYFFRAVPHAPCCPKCGGVKYVPPTPGEAMTSEQSFVCAERMLVQQRGACGDVAAMVAARMRVLEGKPGARVRLVDAGAGARKYHAVVEVDGRIVDATKSMQRGEPGCGCGE